jgi:glutathione synthase/RimK-type ligase-like ATP-grasp enzyme
LPAVLKQPDSAFSRGVVKVTTRAELVKELDALLEDSDLVVVQEFTATDFDWRVVVLDGKPLYACKYYMARNHWQIYKHKSDGSLDDGRSDTFLIENTPKPLVDLAVKAASYIGKGLYGLDIKEKDGEFFIIEINDNPSIDAGCEDKLLKDSLYEEIMKVFLSRMEARTKGVKG